MLPWKWLIGKVSTLPLRDNAGAVVGAQGAQGAPGGPNGPGSLRLGPQDRVLTNLGMTRTIPAIPLAFGGLKVAPVRFLGKKKFGRQSRGARASLVVAEQPALFRNPGSRRWRPQGGAGPIQAAAQDLVI